MVVVVGRNGTRTAIDAHEKVGFFHGKIVLEIHVGRVEILFTISAWIVKSHRIGIKNATMAMDTATTTDTATDITTATDTETTPDPPPLDIVAIALPSK